MQTARIPFTNFQYGEISPSLIGRTDIAVYTASAQKATNFLLRAEGGVIKRSGMKHIFEFSQTVSGTDQNIRIIPFIFSDDERYIVAISAGQFEIFIVDFDGSGNPSAGAITKIQTITADVDGVALSSKITTSIIKDITYAQSGDVLFMCHLTFMPLKLVRSSLLVFEVSDFSFDQRSDSKQIFQPYYSFQSPNVTMTPSSTSGTITVTIRPTGTVSNWASGQSYTVGQLVKDTGLNQVFTVNTAHTSSGAQPLTTNANASKYTAFNYFDTTGSLSGSDYPNSKHVNTTFRYRGQEIEITSVQSGSQATGVILDTLFVKLDINAIRTIKDSSTVEVTMILHNLGVGDTIVVSEADTVNGITNSQLNGSKTVASIIDENTFTYVSGGTATSSGDGGGAPKITTSSETADFEEQSYSKVRGFPAAVCFHEGRLWFGGTLSQPDGIWSSQSGEFFNFNTGTALDNQSIQLASSVGQLDQIKHLISNRDLQIFTESSEFIVPAFENTPVTPTNAMVRRQTPYGASTVKPFVFDGATIYVQRSGTVVREFIFSESEAAYIANGVSTLSSHLITNPVQMTTLQAAIQRPESYIFIVNVDGTIAVFNSNRAEKRAGWTQFITGGSGKFKSICTVDEKVFVIGQYNKGGDGGTEKYVLMEITDSLNLDMARVYSGSSSVFDVSGQFDNGAVLDVISGNDYLGQFTVASGNIDVSAVQAGLSSAEIGFKYDINLKTNPLDIVTATGPTTGMLRGLGRVVLDLNNTLSISVNTRKLEIRNTTDDMSQSRNPVTGKREFRLLGYSRDPQITITQSAPLSAQINSIVAEVQF